MSIILALVLGYYGVVIDDTIMIILSLIVACDVWCVIRMGQFVKAYITRERALRKMFAPDVDIKIPDNFLRDLKEVM